MLKSSLNESALNGATLSVEPDLDLRAPLHPDAGDSLLPLELPGSLKDLLDFDVL